MPFTLYFKYDKTKPHTFQPFFLNQDIIQIFDQFLQNILLHKPYETDPSHAQFQLQNSIVGQKIPFEKFGRNNRFYQKPFSTK